MRLEELSHTRTFAASAVNLALNEPLYAWDRVEFGESEGSRGGFTINSFVPEPIVRNFIPDQLTNVMEGFSVKLKFTNVVIFWLISYWEGESALVRFLIRQSRALSIQGYGHNQ